LAQARHVVTSATRLGMMSEDFGEEDSFGARAMQERTRVELQEMVSSHNILAFIKASLRQGSTSRKTAIRMYCCSLVSVLPACSHVVSVCSMSRWSRMHNTKHESSAVPVHLVAESFPEEDTNE
ncbi:unnamed protein product, partial [Ectocarpus sp. 4 AP-2014]